MWQNAFAVAATQLEEDHPEGFSGAEITTESPPVATIRFVGAVPPGVSDYFSTVPETVRILLIPGEELTATQIDEAVIDAHHAAASNEALGNLVTSYDEGSDEVLVLAEVHDSQLATADSLLKRARRVQDSLPTGSVPIRVVLLPVLANATEQRTGGGRLEEQGSSVLECTSGFNVESGSGVEGVATAGHCDSPMTHENNQDETEYDLTLRQRHRGDWGDFAWYTSPDNEPDDFYYQLSARADVTGRANPVDNQSLCRFGRKEFKDCTTVADLSTCATLGGFETCRLVRMDDDTASGGDSGGPWYSGNTAYGYHTGQVGCGLSGTCDVWSRVTYIDDAINVTVQID